MVSMGMYKIRKQQGVCIKCGGVKTETTVTCEKCRKQINKIMVRQRQVKKVKLWKNVSKNGQQKYL